MSRLHGALPSYLPDQHPPEGRGHLQLHLMDTDIANTQQSPPQH